MERPRISRRLGDQDVVERGEEKLPSRRWEYFPSGNYRHIVVVSDIRVQKKRRSDVYPLRPIPIFMMCSIFLPNMEVIKSVLTPRHNAGEVESCP